MQTINVLVVDDNEIDVKFVRRRLVRSGYNCAITVATDGHEAITLFRRSVSGVLPDWPPALVLLDINMPVMSGFEFLTQLQQLALPEPRPEIYILSSSNAQVDRHKSAETGLLTGYLVKPIAQDELEVILSVLARR